MENLLLGIDIGTSSCKVAVFNENGKIIDAKNGKYDVIYQKVGWAEQNPEDWWNAIVSAIKELNVSKENIKGIGIDGQSWSAIPIDREKNVLCNTPIWFDTRATDICNKVKEEFGENPFFEISGNPFEPSYTLPKILWYKENMPEVYEKMDKVLQSNSYIAMKLTGKISQEYSQGYGLQCYNMRERKWDFSVLEKLGIKTNILPDLFECHNVVGTVTKEVAELTGLKEGTPVVAGGLDAACGTLGAGVIYNGQTQEQGGQAGGMSICTDECISHKALILSNHVVAGKWLLQGGTTGGGGVMNWFEKQFCEYERDVLSKAQKKHPLALIDEGAEKIPVGSDGLIFLPYMSGERSPLWDTNAKGVYFGVDFSKTKPHFARASMEGVGYSLEHNLEVAKEAGVTVDTLYSVGGSANSLLWTGIKSDITGLPIKVPYSDSATTLGACILAGIGVGIYKDFEDAVSKTVKITREHTPNMENHSFYQKQFKKYKAIYENTKDLMKD